MKKGRGKAVIIGIIVVVALLVLGLGVYFYGKAHVMDGDGMTYDAGLKDFQGTWKMIGSYATDADIIVISGTTFESGNTKCTYAVSGEDPYNLNLSDSQTITFPDGDGPWYGDLVYYTQDVDGHTVHFLVSFMEELDGRGLIVMDEYVRDEDAEYLPADFESDLCRKLNDSEAVPTVME